MKRGLCLLVLSLAAAPAAFAQQPSARLAADERASAAARGPWLSLTLGSGLIDRGTSYVARGQRIVLAGRVRWYVRNQRVTVELLRNGRREATKSVAIRRAGSRGRFTVRFKPDGVGRYGVHAVHRQTRTQRWFAGRRKFRAVSLSSRFGASGTRVRLLQRGLRNQAYVAPLRGPFDSATARAVLAFRKVNGMSRNSLASGPVYAALLRRSGGFRLRYPRAGKHVEFDWSRQVLVLARSGRAERIYHSSSGKPSTPTVFGSFRFYRKTPGYNSIGMYYTSYFIRGYAIHGYHSVPTYPASHGCLRVPIADALSIYRWINLGDTIFVYR